jgi:hypothetical protein
MVNDVQQAPRKNRSVWMWMGCGCGLILVLGGLVVGGFIWTVASEARKAAALNHDPVKLASRVQEIVPYHDLPSGYRPVTTFALPFFMDMVIFADREIKSSGAMHQELPHDARSFIVIRTRAMFGRQGFRFSEGDTDRPGDTPGWLRNLGVDLKTSSPVADGTLEVEGHPGRYKVVKTRRYGRHRETDTMAMLMLDCGDKQWLHTVVWSVPTTDDGTSPEGEPTDLKAFASMVGHFSICGADRAH